MQDLRPGSGLPASLDAEALSLFARKGAEGGPQVPQAGIANGAKVRRVVQVTADLAGKPFERLRILDVGCGEGVYAIEAGMHGATVLALDARSERMGEGAACASRHGLANVTFRLEDVRRVTVRSHGRFDVVWCLGLLYHLDAPDLFSVLENLRDASESLLVIDTLVARTAACEVEHRGRRYEGDRVREHADEDPPEVRRGRLLRSVDNAHALRLTKMALLRLLVDLGATSVLEVHAPLEPGRAGDRVTLAVRFGEPVTLSTYPWVNGASREEVERVLLDARAGAPAASLEAGDDLRRFVARLYEHPGLLRMGHNQRAEDLNLGLGWLYYALARIVRPARAVVIGSYRGFVPLVLGKAFADGLEAGSVTFVDPSLVDAFWKDAPAVRAWFESFGVGNVRHVLATTQEFVTSDAYRRLEPIGLLFVDGYHSAEQARLDWTAFEPLLAPRGVALFHDSMVSRTSDLYGADRAYGIRVKDFLDELKRDARFQVFDLPFGTGLTLVRRVGGEASEPWLEGQQARP